MIFTPKEIEFNLSRGDSFSLPIVLNQGTQLVFKPYTLTENDTIYVGIMEPQQSFEDAIIRKKLSMNDECDEDGNVILKLNPQDTENLMTGLYYLTIKLKQGVDVTTVLSMKKFYITGTNPNPENINNEDNIIDTIILDGGEIV